MNLAQSAITSLFFLMSSCADWKPSESSVAPGGKTIAQIEVSLAGAPADNKTRVVIKNGLGGSLPEPVYVVEANNAIIGHTRLRWADADHLQVVLCDATSYRLTTENYRYPAYLDVVRADGTGDPNAVWVEVVNLTYSEKAKGCVPWDQAA